MSATIQGCICFFERFEIIYKTVVCNSEEHLTELYWYMLLTVFHILSSCKNSCFITTGSIAVLQNVSKVFMSLKLF